jgi:hypothetical protein
VAAGDPESARARLEIVLALSGLPVLAEAERPAARLVSVHALPPNAADDALHIAVAAVHGMDYLPGIAVTSPMRKCKGLSARRASLRDTSHPSFAPRRSLWENSLMENNDTLVDPILDEIRRIRDEHAARFDYDMHRICEDIREHEKTSRLKFVTPEPRRPAVSTK